MPHTVAAIVYPAGTLVSAASVTLRARLAESDPLNSSLLLLPIVSTAPLSSSIYEPPIQDMCASRKPQREKGSPFFQAR